MKEFFTVGLTHIEHQMLIAKYLKVPEGAIDGMEWIDDDSGFSVKVTLKKPIESFQPKEACECGR